MTDPVAEASKLALALEPEDRARLAETLLASLRGDVDPDIEAAWDEEIRRRVAEIDAGTAEMVSGEEAFARARRALR